MLETIAKLKPGAPRRAHLLLAAATWMIVGACLLIAGVRWTVGADPPALPLLIAAAVVVGALKAWFALRPAARRVVHRIESRGDGRCIGGFLSWRTWLFVLFMSVAGRLLRLIGLPPAVVGFIYVAVGAALLIASGWLVQGWRRSPR